MKRALTPDPALYVVATTLGVVEARIIAGRLESLGIPTLVHHEPLGSALGLTIGALGEAKVLVPKKYYELAMATLHPDDSTAAIDDGWDEV